MSLSNVGFIMGSAQSQLMDDISNALPEVPVLKRVLKRHPDGEVEFSIDEDSVRRKIVCIIQQIYPPEIDRQLMELGLMIQTAHLASAAEINVVVPCLPYARQDRKHKSRVPISAKFVVRNIIEGPGADRLICFHLHSPQIQGFSDKMPIDNLWPEPPISSYIRSQSDLENLVLVSPDVGGAEEIRKLGSRIEEDVGGEIDIPIAIIEKRRKKDNQPEALRVIGNVKGRDAWLIDDIFSTGSTASEGARILQEEKARSVNAVFTHGEFVGDAFERIEKGGFDKVAVTDSLPVRKRSCLPDKVDVISIGKHLALVLKNVFIGKSVSKAYPQT